ncbi:SDR family oxidoreductase [Paenibacillus maysiensis]|uniref:SDR family oxidoreductase n=1 Tax=Paenibacillus maysiensis TaxID=1155954 RepID=UPI0004719F57|nr:SDR family oxidoreductase [Paenibacillus maysiensis]
MANVQGKTIITGVDGQFGSSVAKGILKTVAPESLIFTSPSPENLEQYRKLGVDVRKADFNSVESIKDAFEGGEQFFLVSMPIIGEKRVQMHKNAVDGAVAAGVKKIVYTSFLGAGDDENPALVTVDHRITEKYVQQSGLKWNFMRDSQYFESLLRYGLPDALNKGEWIFNYGEGKCAFISREDCAKTAVALLLGKGEDNTTYDVTGPELLSADDIVRITTEITGRPLRFVNKTDDEMYALWDSLGVPRNTDQGMKNSPIPWCSDDMVTGGRALREGLMAVLSDDVEKLTGEKRKTIREMIQEAYDHGEL